MVARNESKEIWNSIGFSLKHFMLRFGNSPFEIFLPSKEFSRKPFTLEFTLEFAELLLECSSEILIFFSFESIWKTISWMFSHISPDLSISLQIPCSSLRHSNISPSNLYKSGIFSQEFSLQGPTFEPYILLTNCSQIWLFLSQKLDDLPSG